MQRFASDGQLVLRPAANGMLSGLRQNHAFSLKLLISVAVMVLLISSRQRRQPGAGLYLSSPPGDLSAPGVGLGKSAHDPAIAHRKSSASAPRGLLALALAWWGSAALVRMISTGDGMVALDVRHRSRLSGERHALWSGTRHPRHIDRPGPRCRRKRADLPRVFGFHAGWGSSGCTPGIHRSGRVASAPKRRPSRLEE
jgi:hypothetical protein